MNKQAWHKMKIMLMNTAVLIVEEVLLSCLSSSMEIHISPLVLYIQGSKKVTFK